jgi:hypothetical protein
MDRFIVVSCFALVVVVFGLVGAVSFWPPAPSAGQFTADDAISAARQFVSAEDTFRFDGMADTLKVGLNRTVDGSVFDVVAEFTSRNAGYGDRADKMVATVLTPHRALITVEKGVVTAAIMDGQWDMVTQQSIEAQAPPSTMPARDPNTTTPGTTPDGAQL